MQRANAAKPLPTVGILGGGQLSCMMTEAYHRLGGKVVVYGNSEDDPAYLCADCFLLGARDDDLRLQQFFAQVDVVTLENEFFKADQLIDLSQCSGTPVLPDPSKYGHIEDKLSENRFFRRLGIQIADFHVVNSEDDLVDGPGFLKLAKGGYDGIGTLRVDNRSQAVSAFRQLRTAGTVLFEHEVACVKELSLIAVANHSELVFYPLVETCQEQGTCRYVSFPAGVNADVEQEAREIVGRIMQKLDTAGLFAFEFFLAADGRLILNESAPRPHNSGHITLDLMNCSQFENHMRAIAGLQLREPTAIRDSGLMVNLLATKEGEFDQSKVLSRINDQQLSVNLYGKKTSRRKRKMGHINLWGAAQRQRAEIILDSLDI